MPSGPGVDAVCEGGRFMYGLHNGPQQELYSRMPVSTRDCPPGEWVKKHTHTYKECVTSCSLFAHGLLYSQDGVCVSESDCRCDIGGEQYKPGDIIPLDCNNW